MNVAFLAVALLLFGPCFAPAAEAVSPGSAATEPVWTSANRFRILLTSDPRGRKRSNSPARADIDFRQTLSDGGGNGTFDDNTVEVIAYPPSGQVKTSNSSSKGPGHIRLPHRIDRYFGITGVTLNFVVPDDACINVAVYFDTLESGRGTPKRYQGLIGDGDRFCQSHARREIAASHFDCFVDFDGDGDLDLFQGGVEPYVYCFENVGRNRFVDRGRLTSGGELFTLPHSKSNRSWLTVAFFDLDGDGDQDFFPSFGDGPDAGRIIFYRNTTRESSGQLTFSRVGPLQTVSGVPLAGGAQAGGWFPSITFVEDWDGDGRGPDALVGSGNRCWLYRGLTPHPAPLPINVKVGRVSPSAPQPRHFSTSGALGETRPTTDSGSQAQGAHNPVDALNQGKGRGEGEHPVALFADPVAVPAGGKDIELVNPRFDVADVDADGDLDLFAATQPGPVYWFKNIGTRTKPEFASGNVLVWMGKYLIGDAHSGVKVADFDGDGLLDIVSGRFWERTDLNMPKALRAFGGFFKNIGGRTSPRFARRTRSSPVTEQFQACDALRQNCVRAVDWNGDGTLDLLAGDTDGFIWLFKHLSRGSRRKEAPTMSEVRSPKSEIGVSRPTSAATSAMWSQFATGEKLRADGRFLSVAASGGHARFDICDWNNDGREDLVVADGFGGVTLFLNGESKTRPELTAGGKVNADGKPIQLGPRSSVLVCDWDNDGRKDLVLADEQGYYFCKNIGADAAPLLTAPKPITFGGKRVSYVRPNLGSFVDWDGDGKRDLIGCHFENSIRFYRNVGDGAPGTEPQFADPEGVVILQAESPQMISGADVVDWNGDGDLDLLTGQGHGGSGLRFYERDWLEDELHDTPPVVTIRGVETKPNRP